MNALSFSPRPPKLNRNHTPTPPKKVAIDLTEKGEQQREQIQEAVFSFLALLRQRANGNGGAGIPRYVFEECKALADIAWRFQVRFLEVGGLGVWGCLYGRVGWHGCGWGFYAHTTPGLHKKNTRTIKHKTRYLGEKRAHLPRQRARQQHAGVRPGPVFVGARAAV